MDDLTDGFTGLAVLINISSLSTEEAALRFDITIPEKKGNLYKLPSGGPCLTFIKFPSTPERTHSFRPTDGSLKTTKMVITIHGEVDRVTFGSERLSSIYH